MRFFLLLISLCLILGTTACSQPPVKIEQSKKVESYTRPAVVRVIAYNYADFTLKGELADYLGTTKLTEFDGGMGSGAIITCILVLGRACFFSW
jgi:hypothetical protein